MGTDRHRLTLIGDVGVDFVLGPVSGWPRIGTETLVERSELRASWLCLAACVCRRQ
jgi:ribokinase